MKRMTPGVRPKVMTNQSRIRRLAAAGVLCAALAGCGTAVAATSQAGGQDRAVGAAAAPRVGCDSVNQATTVTVTRPLVVGPLNASSRTVTQRHVTLVRALFRDFCAAVTHPVSRKPPFFCPIDVGIFYTGTFYDGQRILATFLYGPAGCQRLTVTAAGKTLSTFLLGRAAAAAPHLKADFAAVLGRPESQVYGSPQGTPAN
jgi:hypothetical protein